MYVKTERVCKVQGKNATKKENHTVKNKDLCS